MEVPRAEDFPEGKDVKAAETENLPKEEKPKEPEKTKGELIEVPEKERKNHEDTFEIRISLDTYDDIFSDFDPRDYSKRGLSEDFINEVKKASVSRPNQALEVRLLIPENLRDKSQEKIIADRIKTYFLHHATRLKKEENEFFGRGIRFVIIGFILMMIATYLTFEYGKSSLVMDFFIVLLEPGGWFLFWEGLSIVVFESKKMNPEVHFSERVSKSDIEFVPY